MDPYIQNLVIQLAETAARNTASNILDRIAAARARKKQEESIAELEDIIYELIDDKAELSRIAQAFEETLVAQRVSETEIGYITETVVPLIEQFISSSAEDGTVEEEEKAQQQQILDLVKTLLSVETITVLQLLGFNFKQAIGEPLTDLLAQVIRARKPIAPEDHVELNKLQLRREIVMAETARDVDAWSRLTREEG